MPQNIVTLMGMITAAMIRLPLIQIWWASDRYLQSSRESTLYNRHRSALGLVYLHLLSGNAVIFCYYLLGGDTVAPNVLHTRLGHAFLVYFFTMAKLSQYLLDRSSRSITKWKVFGEFSRSVSVFPIPQGMLPWQSF